MMNIETLMLLILMMAILVAFLYVIYPMLKIIYQLKCGNKHLSVVDRYLHAKKMEKYKQIIFQKLVDKEYHFSETFCHYHFNINNEKVSVGILGLLSFMGDDIFKRVDREIQRKNEELKIERMASLKLVEVDNIKCLEEDTVINLKKHTKPVLRLVTSS